MRRCPDCPYWYVDSGDWDCPSCHYDGPDAWAPCAQDENEMEEEENEDYIPEVDEDDC